MAAGRGHSCRPARLLRSAQHLVLSAQRMAVLYLSGYLRDVLQPPASCQAGRQAGLTAAGWADLEM